MKLLDLCKMDLSKLCRSCMKEVTSWERGNFNDNIVDMFCFCTNIVISDEDILPKQFCYNCFIKIESSYTFIQEAQKVNITLKNIDSRIKTSIIVETENHARSFNSTDYAPKSNISNFTLPDYEMNNSIDSFDEQTLFIDDINHQPHVSNINDYTQIEPNTFNSLGDSSLKNSPLITSNPEQNETNWQISSRELCEIEQKNLNCYNSNNDCKTNLNNQSVSKQTNDGKVKLDTALQKKFNSLIKSEPKKVKDHVCSFCKKKFSFRTWLERHTMKEHAGLKYSCKNCTKSFTKPCQLSEHSLSHSTTRVFSCSICSAQFKRQKQLTVHTKLHRNVRPYHCSHCMKRFKTKNVLITHIKLHKDDKPYLCSVCGWKFAQSGNLEVHMRRHTGAKPYKCGECSFSSSVSSSLSRHLLRHSGHRRHVCAQCQRGFYDASGLARHIRTHTGALPYKCPYCERAFTDSWKRKTHLMRQHKLTLGEIPPMPRDPARKETVAT